MSQKNYYIVGGIIAVLIVAGLLFNQNKKASNEQDTNKQTQESNNSQESQKEIDSQKENTDSQNGSTKNWIGTLKTSDNLSKGNLMLVTKERNIYLKTSRDWKKLVNTEVRVAYDGNLESFTLIDIWPMNPTNN